MSILMTALQIGTLVFAPAPNDEHDLELATVLARRGWIELAEEICGRVEKNPAASAAAKSGLPLVLAEVSVAKARNAVDARVAAKELDLAVERLSRAGRTPSLDERGMTGWLHVQKAKILSGASEDDATLRPDAMKSWEAAETFYRKTLAELEKLPAARAVDEAMLDARLEIPKALAAQARVPSIDASRRRKLLEESVRMFSDFMFGIPTQPVLLEAVLEEGRSRADLEDHARAERCFRSLRGLAQDLKKQGYPIGEYVTSQLHGGVLALVGTLTTSGKAKEAASTCDDFLRDNPKLERTAMGYAICLAKADALTAMKDEAGAIELALKISAQDPDGAAGRMARAKVRRWMTGKNATPDRVMTVADGLMERGQYREALVDLRRCVELCRTPAERAKVEPVAAYKRGDCFRAMKQDAEASAAWQEVFRKYPAHELAKRAAFEAVRSLSRLSAASGDRPDEEQMEKLLDEVEQLGLQGTDGDFIKFLRGEILERKGQFKAAAERFIDISEACEIYSDAMVSAGHCYRIDAEQRWDKARGTAALREEIAKQLGTAEAALRRALPRLEAGGRERTRLLAIACYELAAVSLHESIQRTKDARDFLGRCARLLPPESEMHPRLAELEIQAFLVEKDVESAASRVERMLTGFPDSVSTARACRRVALRLESGDPARAERFFRAWLDRAPALGTTTAELQSVADGFYRIARARNGFDDKVHSLMDLKGKPVRERGVWREAARAHELLIQAGGLAEKDAVVAATRLAWCCGFMADSAADWSKAKAVAEKLIQGRNLLNNGAINIAVLQQERWLLGLYIEYGHSLFQLGKSGQKFQFTNALTVYNNLLNVTENGSEPWWIAKYMGVKSLFERGETTDIRVAGAALSLLEGNYPDFDGGKFGMKDQFVELRGQVRAASGLQR